MMEFLGQQGSELSVLVCDDETIHELNQTYRGKDAPTDVLSFETDMPLVDGMPRLLGDIVISIDTARKQARERSHPIAHEVTFLLAHGLLHLLGYDHKNDQDEAQMNEKTRELVRLVSHHEGLGGKVYAK